MKQIIIATFFILNSVIPAIAQKTYPTYKIIDIKNIHFYETIATATEISDPHHPHQTVQFLAIGKMANELKIDSCVKMNYNGEYMAPCRTTATYTSPNNDTLPNTKVWKIVKPSFIQPSTVTELLYVNIRIFIAVKRDSSGYTGFYISNNALHLHFGQIIFQNTFNNKKYAIVMPYDQDEVKYNLFYSFELNFMSKQTHDSIVYKNMHPYDTSQAPQTQKLNTGAQPWEIQMDPTIKGIGGQVTMQVPKELRYHTHMQFYDAGDTKKQLTSWFGNNKAKLLPGLYDIVVDGKYTIKNVPVELGNQTRLKMGVLKVSNYGSFEIENSSHQKFIYAPPFSILLPEGTYYINGKKKVPIVIKDGGLTEL